MRVTNLNASRPIVDVSTAWLAYWEKMRGQNAYLCSVKECINRPSVGGLVQKKGQVDDSWYVVPLCKDCNNKTGQDLDIWDQATLVRTGESAVLRHAPARPVSVSRISGSLTLPRLSSDRA